MPKEDVQGARQSDEGRIRKTTRTLSALRAYRNGAHSDHIALIRAFGFNSLSGSDTSSSRVRFARLPRQFT